MFVNEVHTYTNSTLSMLHNLYTYTLYCVPYSGTTGDNGTEDIAGIIVGVMVASLYTLDSTGSHCWDHYWSSAGQTDTDEEQNGPQETA